MRIISTVVFLCSQSYVDVVVVVDDDDEVGPEDVK